MKDNDRNRTIAAIKAALRRRSGKAWSVTGGRGTAWGWIKIDTLPARATWREVKIVPCIVSSPDNYRWEDQRRPGGYMSPAECAELGRLLGLEGPVHFQGESIPASGGHYAEYIDRAEGRTPSRIGVQYWD